MCDNVLSYEIEAIIKSICLGIASTRLNNANLHLFSCKLDSVMEEKYLATNDLLTKTETIELSFSLLCIYRNEFKVQINKRYYLKNSLIIKYYDQTCKNIIKDILSN